jgi:tetratricopeptide (TPR) repeat protein
MKTISQVTSLLPLRFVFLLCAAFFIYCTSFTANGQDLQSRISIAILPLEDQTKAVRHAHWRHSLSNMIAKPLEQIKQVRICDPEAAEYGLRRCKLSAGDAINAEQAKNIGEIIEARRVISGHFGRKGKNWIVTVNIMAVADGTSSPAITATSDDWLTLTQELAEKILRELKVSPTEEQKQQMQMRMTNSAEALDYYSRCYAMKIDKKPFAEVTQMAQKAIKLDPKFANAYLAYGSSLLNQGKMQEGRAQIEHVLKLQPKNSSALMILGSFSLLNRNPTDAAKYLRSAVQYDPDDPDKYIRLSEYHSALNEYDKSVEQLEIAMKLNPVSADVNAQLGLIYAHMAKKELALRAMQNAVLIDASSSVYQKVAIGYDHLGMTSQAIEYFEKFIASARKSGLDPEGLKHFEERLQHLQTSLKTEYVTATEPRRFTPEELRKELRERLTPKEFSQIIYPLDSSPAMKQWAVELTKDAKDDMAKARALYDALAQHLSPSAGDSRTAQQVFEDWKKPEVSFRCQEYARLYVALAREVGLNAYFAPVSRDHDDKAIMHACAALFFEGKVILVDVNYRWFGVPHKKFSISNDYEAIVMQMNQTDGLAYKRIAVKLQPDSLSLFNLAGCLVSEDETEEAKVVFERFLQTDGEPWLKHYALAALALFKEDWIIAEKELKQTIEISTAASSTHFNLGMVLLKKQDFSGALDSFRMCIQTKPSNDEEKQCRSLIARIHEKLAEANRTPSQVRKDKWRSELLEQSNRKFAFFECIPMICPAAGLIYNTKSESLGLEIEALRQQSEQEPENALCRYRMGFLLQDAMRDKERDLAMKDAEQVARTIMKIRPDDLDAMHVLVRCLQGKEEAGILANKAVELHPNDWRAWMCLAYHQNENFMRALCEGLDNLPPQGYDEERLEAVFSVLSESPDECKKFIKMINECFATSEKAVELSKDSSQAWEYLLGMRNRLLDCNYSGS